ncbi:lariat debranching enzyme isoform X2 [Aristolochia californica]|uniref:lariat debranching enzyme isoform X2 n=1 Tax=Aristolochia californica TaxID=171875 RepID=UPI0035E15C7D
MKIAVEGCMHGDLDNVYSTLLHLEKAENTKIDLLICCGDFQAVRNENDLESVNVPYHYRSMNSFWKYYSGQEVAPVPTIFIGGNHEASNYLWELYYGGWAAPNVYFLGFAGIIKFGNIRIGGISGIYNPRHYYLGHYERPPYNNNDIRSVYHVREYDVYKLLQVKEQIDIFVSHDWPCGITDYGNWEQLLQQKPYFEKEIKERTLGSKAAAELLDKLKPPYWFSAHLHCKFPAIVQHGQGGPITKFLALDKCIRGRNFLQILEIESDSGPHEIEYDEEWLTITKKLNSLFPLTKKSMQFGAQQVDLLECRECVREKLRTRGCKPFDFVQTVPSYDPSQSNSKCFLGHCRNPQTESFLQLLELPYLLDGTVDAQGPIKSPTPLNSAGKNDHTLDYSDEYIDIDNVDEREDLVDED